MKRRTLLTVSGTAVTAAVAGCLASGDNRQIPENPSFNADDHENHKNELSTEIERRDVELNDLERRGETIVVDYDSESMNDDLAEVAMAFVERIDGGWGIARLDAIARVDVDLAWHAEAKWAQQYLDNEIDAAEYGQRISETIERTLVIEGDESDE